MKRKACLLLLIIGILLITVPDTWANGNRSRNLVAPYAHFVASASPATGPFTTHYLISNMRPAAITVNVKCYSDGAAVRVGPAAGTNFNIASHAIAFADPVTLGLTTDPSYTGFGWCYFAGTDYFAVGFVTGYSVGGNLITNNNARSIMSGTAEHFVSTNLAGIPYWTSESSWETFMLAINPTTTTRTLNVDAYNNGGTLIGTWTTPLQARDLDYGILAALVGVPAFGGWGNADISVSGRGFVGWVAGLNSFSLQAFIVPVSLSDIWLSELTDADRP